jgi:hypothetical protein
MHDAVTAADFSHFVSWPSITLHLRAPGFCPSYKSAAQWRASVEMPRQVVEDGFASLSVRDPDKRPGRGTRLEAIDEEFEEDADPSGARTTARG